MESGIGRVRIGGDPFPGGDTALTAYWVHAEIRLVLRCSWREFPALSPGGTGETSGSRTPEPDGRTAGHLDSGWVPESTAVPRRGAAVTDRRRARPGEGVEVGETLPAGTGDHRHWADMGL